MWASLAATGCQDQTDPFQCGTPLNGSKDVVQDCSEHDQVCVCANRSCARKVDSDLCESKYQYLEPPFVTRGALEQVERIAARRGPDAERRCVPAELVDETKEKRIDPEDTVRRCDGAQASGGGDAGTTTTSTDTGSGGTSVTSSTAATGGGEATGGSGGTGGAGRGTAGGVATTTTGGAQ